MKFVRRISGYLMAFLLVLLSASAASARNTSLIEKIESDLAKDRAFSAEERLQYADEFRQQLGGYAFDLLRGGRIQGSDVLMRIVMEGSFDGVDVERTVGIATAAYVAIRRGSDPEVVEGISLYGFRKKIPADKIEAWANGFNECVKAGVPPYIAEDLVYNAAEHDWDIRSYDALKWGLADAAREDFAMEDFYIYTIGNFLKGQTGAGHMAADALRYFRKMRAEGKKPELPEYSGSFVSRKAAVQSGREEPKGLPPSVKSKGKEQSESPEVSKREKEPKQEPASPIEGHASEPVKASVEGSLSRIMAAIDRGIRSFLGTPYVWGGETEQGTDCSGFVRAVYSEVGISLPRIARDQWLVGKKVGRNELRKGDLVFFITSGNRISHVGIMSDSGEMQFAHASSSRGVVFSNLNDRYYRARYAGARRVLPTSMAFRRGGERSSELLSGIAAVRGSSVSKVFMPIRCCRDE